MHGVVFLPISGSYKDEVDIIHRAQMYLGYVMWHNKRESIGSNFHTKLKNIIV